MKKSVKCIIAGGIIAIAGAGLFATTLAYGATGYSSRFLTIGFDRDDREFEIGFHDDDYDDWYHRDNAESSYINWDFSQYASSETSPMSKVRRLSRTTTSLLPHRQTPLTSRRRVSRAC